MNYAKELAERVKRDAAERFKNHTVTVRHNEGLYRQWRCQQPGTWVNGFDVTTWPGYLAITGDIGDYVFARTKDMVPWIRGAVRSPGYAAEKCVCGDTHEDRLELVDEWLANFAENNYGGLDDMPEAVHAALADLADARRNAEDVLGFQEELFRSSLYDGEMPQFQAFRYHFLWCLEALAWWLKAIE